MPVSTNVSKNTTSLAKDAGGAINKVQALPNNSAPKGQTVTPQGQGQDDVDGEELVKDTRVKFREWDPVSTVKSVYSEICYNIFSVIMVSYIYQELLLQQILSMSMVLF